VASRCPRLYVIDGDEMKPTTLDEHSYSITVTRGLLERSTNAESEAVGA